MCPTSLFNSKNLPAKQETWVRSLGWKDLLEKEQQPTPVFLPGQSHGQRNLVGCSPWGLKEQDTTEQLSRHKIKGMALDPRLFPKEQGRESTDVQILCTGPMMEGSPGSSCLTLALIESLHSTQPFPQCSYRIWAANYVIYDSQLEDWSTVC